MAVKAHRILTDAGDTVLVAKFSDGSFNFDIIDDAGTNAMQLLLTERDIREISDVIHSDSGD